MSQKPNEIRLEDITIGSHADYIDLDWSREEDRAQLREILGDSIIEMVGEDEIAKRSTRKM